MKIVGTLLIVFLLVGCDALTSGTLLSPEAACSCVEVTSRLTSTFTCTGTDLSEADLLCEDGPGGINCEPGPSVTWSASDLSCNTVFCATSDPGECQVDCSCSEASGEDL